MTARTNFAPQEFWDAKHSLDYPGLFQPTELAIKALPLFSKNPGSTILEIGCGRSGDALFFGTRGFNVMAIDVSRVALKEMKNEGYKVKNIYLVQSNVSQGLPFSDNSVDAVYSRLSLHYFQDAETKSIFGEIRRVLKVSGLFVMNVKSAEEDSAECNFPNETKTNEHPRHFFTVAYAKSLTAIFCQSHVVSSRIVSGDNHDRKTIEVFATK